MDYRIHTDHLDLVAATTEHLNAELAAASALAAMLDVRIHDGWPPGEYDGGAITYFRDRMKDDPGMLGWYSWYALLRSSDGLSPMLIGAAGYFGPPGADGEVEIGYSIVPRYEGRGYATEIVQALVDHAFASAAVHRVRAHAQPTNSGSMRVLEKNGFHRAGSMNEAGLVLWTRVRDE
jgi:[ribosomal protein S5]-alanine N-acetyltransferase